MHIGRHSHLLQRMDCRDSEICVSFRYSEIEDKDSIMATGQQLAQQQDFHQVQFSTDTVFAPLSKEADQGFLGFYDRDGLKGMLKNALIASALQLSDISVCVSVLALFSLKAGSRRNQLAVV